ncbi:MAG: hypothetical protein IT582_08280 [Opitutaceae bacterium]|nr:hypothetical protein [Opitutaceae bacterium]
MIENTIKQSIDNLLRGIQSRDATVIHAETANLDAMLDSARGQLPPQLIHYLVRRNYIKALAFMEGND